MIPHRSTTMLPQAARVVLLVVLSLVTAGCPVSMHRVAGDTELLTESGSGYRYYLYIPSWHRQDRQWPMVVTCHGTQPWDSALQQILEWRGLAEQLGIVVVAPQLKAVSSVGVVPADSQLANQQQDERAVLDIVRQTTSAFNVNPNWVFLTGWSGGGYDVYYIGLRNPHVFRALASRMGTFKPSYLGDVEERLDIYQPVLAFFASGDFDVMKSQARQAVRWLKSKGMKRTQFREITGGHQRRPEVAAEFFKDVVEKYAFVKLSAVKGIGGNPLAVQFYLSVDPKPKATVWEFGDGDISNQTEPSHTYAKGGDYEVKVTVITPRGARTTRTMKLSLFSDG